MEVEMERRVCRCWLLWEGQLRDRAFRGSRKGRVERGRYAGWVLRPDEALETWRAVESLWYSGNPASRVDANGRPSITSAAVFHLFKFLKQLLCEI